MNSETVRGKGVAFDRLRRITGYLVGSIDRWNSGKKAEENDRVKHEASKLDEIEATAVINKYTSDDLLNDHAVYITNASNTLTKYIDIKN